MNGGAATGVDPITVGREALTPRPPLPILGEGEIGWAQRVLLTEMQWPLVRLCS